MLDIKGNKDTRARSPKQDKNSMQSMGGFFLIHVLDYGILCTYCKKMLDICKHWRERFLPTLLSEHFL